MLHATNTQTQETTNVDTDSLRKEAATWLKGDSENFVKHASTVIESTGISLGIESVGTKEKLKEGLGNILDTLFVFLRAPSIETNSTFMTKIQKLNKQWATKLFELICDSSVDSIGKESSEELRRCTERLLTLLA